MQFTDFSKLDLNRVPSPCFVVDEVAVERNLKILNDVQTRSGAKVLHALKAFSMFSLAPLTTKYLSGTCSSGLHEALLGKEYYGGEVHVFSAAFTESDFKELLTFANHIVFNTPSQLVRFAPLCEAALKTRNDLQFGLRINPEHSEGDVEIYDPCAKGSRLGTTYSQLVKALEQSETQRAFKLISGFHFHTLCEQDFLPLERTLNVVEEKFAKWLPTLTWLNFGGGHHITAPDYQIDELVECIKTIKNKYQVEVYLEPGEAVAIGTGVLVAEVLDIGFNQLAQAILDTSATCHMPDTLEMPYRPDITNSGEANEKAHTYRLGGLTCLAGDVINDYSFDEPLEIGQRLVFEDMAHYTMVKTSTFNGTHLPAIATWNSQTNVLKIVRTFSYDDFKMRLS
ncbi:carboxynorspermidine decarboxylase [Oceaniserpentilla sp. 4NH20-0058]|uniref:carboxynorspermidine decarboxylase n=1 Tax=Oceaniserpentilla sp. 4NH20-0058 TaxID=3127660 RepID=UPI00310AE59A